MKKLFLLAIGLALLCKTDAFAVLVFWDTNGTDPGSGGSAPTGTWGADGLNWNTNAAGGGATGPEKWSSANFAVFAAGDDAVGAYTIYVSNTVKVADIHVDLGTITFEPDPTVGGTLRLATWDDANVDHLLSAGHKDPNATAIYNVVLASSNGIVRYKRGTVILGVTNKFTGPVTIEGGIVQLGVPYAVPTDSQLILANNDTSRPDFGVEWQYTPAVFHTGGFDQQLGTLKLTGTDASIVRALNFGNGSGTLSFADSSAEYWAAFTLSIEGYALGSSKLRFGTSSSGLTATQLAQIRFTDYLNLPGVIDKDGYLTPNLPKIIGITLSGGTAQLVWTAVSGRTYRLWSKDALVGGTWDYKGDVVAGGDTASAPDSLPSPTGRFYRVEVLP